MNKSRLKYGILLLSLLLCFLPAGAYAGNSVSGSFTVPDNPIINLAVSNPTYTSLTLTWTSPKSSPKWGPATKYDIRLSLSPITTEAEWQAATQLANIPIPKPPGSPETLIVIGLNPCTVYYFAIKAADGSGTWTPLSNSPSGKTLCYSGGGGLGASPPPGYAACPLTLAANMQGTVATVRMTKDGVLCAACLAKDAANKYTLEIDEDAKVTLAGNVVPLLLTCRESSATPPTPENTVLVSPVYVFNAYPSTYETTPSPISISPSARLLLTYDPDELPQNTMEVFIANYDTEEGWLALASVPGAVAEIGKAHGLVAHFSLFAVLAKLQEPAPAKFEVSNLTISPSQIQLNQEITISLNVTNTGGKSGDYNLELKVNGTVKSTTQVTVAPGASQIVNLTLTGDAAGKHQIEVAGLSGEFEVIKSAVPSAINWWFIGSITGIILVLAIWAIIGWRWLKDRKKAASAAVASTDAPADTPTDTPHE
jgi:hypothetical protein